MGTVCKLHRQMETYSVFETRTLINEAVERNIQIIGVLYKHQNLWALNNCNKQEEIREQMHVSEEVKVPLAR